MADTEAITQGITQTVKKATMAALQAMTMTRAEASDRPRISAVNTGWDRLKLKQLEFSHCIKYKYAELRNVKLEIIISFILLAQAVWIEFW